MERHITSSDCGFLVIFRGRTEAGCVWDRSYLALNDNEWESIPATGKYGPGQECSLPGGLDSLLSHSDS